MTEQQIQGPVKLTEYLPGKSVLGPGAYMALPGINRYYRCMDQARQGADQTVPIQYVHGRLTVDTLGSGRAATYTIQGERPSGIAKFGTDKNGRVTSIDYTGASGTKPTLTDPDQIPPDEPPGRKNDTAFTRSKSGNGYKITTPDGTEVYLDKDKKITKVIAQNEFADYVADHGAWRNQCYGR